jgi:hypothetical protein
MGCALTSVIFNVIPLFSPPPFALLADFHPMTKELYFTNHGRDWLGDDVPIWRAA